MDLTALPGLGFNIYNSFKPLKKFPTGYKEVSSVLPEFQKVTNMPGYEQYKQNVSQPAYT